jgi:large subunit ribosomal protein L24
MNSKLRAGDQIVVIAGNDRGKIGKIISKKGERITVEGVNVRKKHMKRTQQNQKGQIIDLERPFHISNVRPYANDKAVKLRVRTNAEGARELYYLDGSNEVLYRSVRNSKS